MKRLTITLAALLLLLALAGCGSQDTGEASFDPHNAVAAIQQSVEFRDSLMEADQGLADNYYKLDGIADYAIFISGSGATAEEIAVLRISPDGSLEDARASLERRVADLKFQFEDYVPAEMVKLENPVIITKGVMAVMVIADDHDAAKQVVDSLF